MDCEATKAFWWTGAEVVPLQHGSGRRNRTSGTMGQCAGSACDETVELECYNCALTARSYCAICTIGWDKIIPIASNSCRYFRGRMNLEADLDLVREYLFQTCPMTLPRTFSVPLWWYNFYLITCTDFSRWSTLAHFQNVTARSMSGATPAVV